MFNMLVEGKSAYIGGGLWYKESPEVDYLMTTILDISFNDEDIELLVEGQDFDVNIDEFHRAKEAKSEDGQITILYENGGEAILFPV